MLAATGAVAAAAVICAVLAAEPSGRTDSVNEQLQWYVENGFDNLQNMATRFQSLQRDVIPLVPPGMPYLLFDQGLHYAKWSGFPKDFVSGLSGVLENGVAVYPVVCYEDGRTRDFVYINAAGKEFYRIAQSPGYDPHWVLLAWNPNVYNEGRPQDEILSLEWQFDPARVVARYTLIGRQELRELLEAQAKAEAEKPIEPMRMEMEGGSGGPSISNLIFSVMDKISNSIYLELSYPTNFTNQVDIFTVDGGTGLVDNWWTLRLTTNISTSTNFISWTDTSSSNVNVRFYVAGNADLTESTDPDGDLLPWAHEKFLYHSSPTNYDTDDDGLSDYEEAINLHTDPCNNDTGMPTAVIAFPTNNFNWVWLP